MIDGAKIHKVFFSDNFFRENRSKVFLFGKDYISLTIVENTHTRENSKLFWFSSRLIVSLQHEESVNPANNSPI